MMHLARYSGKLSPSKTYRCPRLVAQTARFLADESGQDLIEYALVAALIGLGAVTSMKGLSEKVGNAFNSIGTSLTSNV